MRLTVQVEGLKEVRDMLSSFSDRRFAASVATALTRTARDVAADWRDQFESRFDRPTDATLRAVRWKRAEATNLQAQVTIDGEGRRTNPADWLLPEDMGGPRGVKRFEAALQAQGSMPAGWRAVPGPGAKLDGYGNVSRGQIVQVIAQLGAKYSPGYQRVISKSAAKRAAQAQARGRAYVAILPGQKVKLAPGVYERKGRGLQAVFFFVSRVQYRKATDLLGSAQRNVPGILNGHLQRAIQESAARLAAR